MQNPAPVIHFDFVALADHAASEPLDALKREAASLCAMGEVVGGGLIEAEPGNDFDLAFFFVLRDFTALEPFGTDPRYSRFLQRFVAPVLRQLAGADVRLETSMPSIRPHAACLSLSAEEETYDWEVSEALEAWSGTIDGETAIGLAVGERQRYRGVALTFADHAISATSVSQDQFSATLIAGRCRSLT